MEEDTFYDSLEEPLTLESPKTGNFTKNTNGMEKSDSHYENAEGNVSPKSNGDLDSRHTSKSFDSRKSESKSVSFLEFAQVVQQPKKIKKRAVASTKPKFCNSYLEMYQTQKKDYINNSSYASSSNREAANRETGNDELATDELYFRESKHDSESLHNNLFLYEKSMKSPSKSSFTCSLSSFSNSRPATPSVHKARCSSKNIQSTNSSRLLKIPELGGLGPDVSQEKLNSFRRRMTYAKSVSEKNKNKLEEKKLLKSLQYEINECKNI